VFFFLDCFLHEAKLHENNTLLMDESGVSQCDHSIYIKKNHNAKEELWKFKYFTMQKKILIFNEKKSSKRN
jgi:hypothetical protein